MNPMRVVVAPLAAIIGMVIAASASADANDDLYLRLIKTHIVGDHQH